MSNAFDCPRGHVGRWLEIKPLFRYVPRSFLGWRWIARVPDGFLARCTYHGCGRVSVVAPDGVHDPGPVAFQPRDPAEADAERNGAKDHDEHEERPAPLPLGAAVRRIVP